MRGSEKPAKFLMQAKNENQNDAINQGDYYRRMKLLARQKRDEYEISLQKINLTLIRNIYKKEEITIDYWDIKSPRIKASYHCDETDSSVLVKKSLPGEPKLFALIHELKHHFTDREGIMNCSFACGDYNANKIIEVGAEIFAAEFIFPESEMKQSLANFGLKKSNCNPTIIVEYKRNCGVPVSYQYILKRLEFFQIIEKNSFDKVKFKNLEETLYPPIYKQQSYIEGRKRKFT